MADSAVFICTDMEQLRDFCSDFIQRVTLKMRDIKQSAASGCKLCRVIMASFHETDDNDLAISLQRLPSGLRLNTRISPESLMLLDEIELLTLEDCGPGVIRQGTAIGESTDSVAALNVAEKWLHSCLTDNTHSHCHSMPTNIEKISFRILEVISPAIVVLRETSEIAPMKSYACLSHCWGGKIFIQTTKANKDRHSTGIDVSRLPRNFRDAIQVIIRLDIKYIWIDSLCIIQDDPHDWNTQAALMVEIYRNATLTISAAASKDPQEGLFRFIPEVHHLHQIHHEIPECPMVYARKPIHHRENYQLPLFQRGWVMQERLLSPRVLHFGLNEIFWECMTTDACECGGEGKYWATNKFLIHPSRLASMPAPQMMDTWHTTVETFFKLKLTEESDIFPAISGVAKIVSDAYHQRGTAARYLAGMWDCSFIADCLWQARDSNHIRRPSRWRAPSFSWASILDGGNIGIWIMSYILVGPRYVYSKLEYGAITITGEDEMGKIRDGFVVLTGTLFKAVIKKRQIFGGFGDHEWSLRASSSNLPAIGIHPDYNFDAEGEHSLPEGTGVSCLQLMSGSSPEWAKEGKPYSLFCLVLRPVRRTENEVYERIGIAVYPRKTPPLEGEPWFGPDAVAVHNARVKII